MRPPFQFPKLTKVPAAPIEYRTHLSRTTAIFLALLFGGVGAHKFYLGQTKTGVLYVMFSMLLIPVLLGWIDGAALIRMDRPTFERRFGKRVRQPVIRKYFTFKK